MKYEFFRDELGTIWYRDCIEIEADSYEEAVRKVIDLEKSEDWYEHSIYTEPIYETWDPSALEEGDGYATIEIEDPETQKIVWKNGK